MQNLKQGSLILVDFSPTIGHEQSGKRPALVVSADEFNREMKDLAWVVPITSHVKARPDEVALPDGLPVSGVLLLGQLRALDLRMRNCTVVGHVGNAFMEDEVLGRLIAVLTG